MEAGAPGASVVPGEGMKQATAETAAGSGEPLDASAFRILVLFGNLPLWGQERANIETLACLRSMGAEVLFLIRREYTEDAIQPELKRRQLSFFFVPYYAALRYGADLRTWWFNLLSIVSGSWQLLVLIRRYRATHLHVGSIAWVINFLPALVISRTPLVFRAGDVPHLHHSLWRFVWWFTCRRAAVFVCDSEFVRTSLIRLGAPAKACRVAYAPPPDRVRSGQPPRPSLPRRDPNRLTFLYVGQISAAKGVELLVDAAVQLVRRKEPCRFLIAGDPFFRNPFGQALVDRVKLSGLSEAVCFLGYQEDLDSLYEISDVHIAPTVTEEPYGLTVLEAKNHGIPSIVLPSGGMLETVLHGVEGLVCKEKTADSLRQALELYLAHPELVSIHGVAALESLLGRLHVQDYPDQWRSAYQSVMR